MFELLCVVALSLIVYLNKDTETNIEEMIAVYAFATFRIMPSFVKFTIILQTIKLSKSSINVIENEYLNKMKSQKTFKETKICYLELKMEIKINLKN